MSNFITRLLYVSILLLLCFNSQVLGVLGVVNHKTDLLLTRTSAYPILHQMREKWFTEANPSNAYDKGHVEAYITYIEVIDAIKRLLTPGTDENERDRQFSISRNEKQIPHNDIPPYNTDSNNHMHGDNVERDVKEVDFNQLYQHSNDNSIVDRRRKDYGYALYYLFELLEAVPSIMDRVAVIGYWQNESFRDKARGYNRERMLEILTEAAEYGHPTCESSLLLLSRIALFCDTF